MGTARPKTPPLGVAASGPERASRGSPAGEKLALVVDDEEHVRKMVAELLSRAGWRCIEAPDAERALALLEEHSPRLGVLDLALPGMNGAELAWKIRERRPDISLIALSGHLCRWDADDLADLGFDRIFAKPMDCEEFIRFCRDSCAS